MNKSLKKVNKECKSSKILSTLFSINNQPTAFGQSQSCVKSRENFPKMNYLIMYLTSCVAVDKDSCCDIKPITSFHGLDKTAVGCMAECAVEIGMGSVSAGDDSDLLQTQCTADCLGKKKGYVSIILNIRLLKRFI